jgi:hypothetical protein
MSFLRPFGFCALLVAALQGPPGSTAAATLPPLFLDCVVALGHDEPIRGADGIPVNPAQSGWFTEGTGYFYGHLVVDDPDATKRKYQLFLVTARHVIFGHQAVDPAWISVRLNPSQDGQQADEFRLPIIPQPGQNNWFFPDDPSVDLALVPINAEFLKSNGVRFQFFTEDTSAAEASKLRSLGAAAGDSIFVLGFPMNMTGKQRNYVIARQGIIARIQELLDGHSNRMLIDSFVFPGNSGGPVVLRPEIMSVQGTTPNNIAYLIGTVVDFVTYTDVAQSLQTHRPRITFEENSGLAEVIPIDEVDKAIANWLRQHPLPSATSSPSAAP